MGMNTVGEDQQVWKVMIANSYFDGVIKTIGTMGQAGSKTTGGLKNRKPKEREGKRIYLCVGGPTQLHSSSIYGALLEAWLCVKGWPSPRPCFGVAKNIGGRTTCRW